MDKRPKIHPEYISNKGKRVFFDGEYYVPINGIDEDDTSYMVRIEGKIIEETDNQFKIKTGNWWCSYGHSIISYPKSLLASRDLNPPIAENYWVDKDKTTFLK